MTKQGKRKDKKPKNKTSGSKHKPSAAASASPIAQMKTLIIILIVLIAALVAVLVFVFVILPGMGSGGGTGAGDSDGDGILDLYDNCPNTPAGVQIGPNGCALGVEDCGNGNCAGTETCATCPGDCLAAGQVCCNDVAQTGNCCTDADCAGTQLCVSYNCVAQVAECADGLDNDGNGCSDWPFDSGCDTADDTTESTGVCYCADDDVTTDFPDGKNYATRGTCVDLTPQTLEDSCVDSTHLSEKYCIATSVGNPQCTYEVYTCQQGYECMAGRCVPTGTGGENCEWQSIATLGDDKEVTAGSLENITLTNMVLGGQFKINWEIRRADGSFPVLINMLLIEDPDGTNVKTDYDNVKIYSVLFNETSGSGKWVIKLSNFNDYSVYYDIELYQWICEGWDTTPFNIDYGQSSMAGTCSGIDVEGYSAEEAAVICTNLGKCEEPGEQCEYDADLEQCACGSTSSPQSACEAYEVEFDSDTAPQEQCEGLDCNTGECVFSWDTESCGCEDGCMENWTIDDEGTWYLNCSGECTEPTYICEEEYILTSEYGYKPACFCIPPAEEYCSNFIGSIADMDSEADAWADCSVGWCPGSGECVPYFYTSGGISVYYECECLGDECGYQHMGDACAGDCPEGSECVEGYKYDTETYYDWNLFCECCIDSTKGESDGFGCYDSDANAANPHFVRGYCEDATGTFIDDCYDEGNVLNEWYCVGGVCVVEQVDYSTYGDDWWCSNGLFYEDTYDYIEGGGWA